VRFANMLLAIVVARIGFMLACSLPLIVAACSKFGGPTSGSTNSSSNDAGPPGSDSGPGDGRRFCERAPQPFVFCDDFEDSPRATTLGWDGQIVTRGDISIGSSPPSAVPASQRSLHVVVSSDGVSHDARLGREVKVTAGFRKLEMSYRALVHSGNIQFARLGTFFMAAASFVEIQGVTLFASGPRGLLLDGDLQAVAPTLSTQFDRWHTCSTTLTLDSGENYRATTQVGDLVVSNEVVRIDPAARIDLLFGVLQTSDDDATVDVWLDDLVLRVEQ
jgi:hypothetical protein